MWCSFNVIAYFIQMFKKIPLLLVSCSILISACHSSINLNFSNQYYPIPINSTLILNQQLVIPPNKTGIYLQGGIVMDRPSINVYNPNCRFEVYSLSDKATVVNRDQFRIYKILFESELVFIDSPKFASLGNIFAYSSATAEIRTTEFYIKSDLQPDVFRIRCEHWEDPNMANYLTYEQILNVFGDVITVQKATNEHNLP